MLDTVGGGYAVELWLSEDYAGGLQDEVERAVAAALESARERGPATVTVEVHEGRATLSGRVPSWAAKQAARGAAMGVAGVKGVEDGAIAVEPAGEARSDAELLLLARAALDADSRVPAGVVRVTTRAGRITLSGTLGHEDERSAAEQAVCRLVGAREVVNALVVPPRGRPAALLGRVDEELRRALRRDARHVRVAARDAGVELSGRLPSLALREVAVAAVRRVLGDVPVANRLR